MRTDKSLKKKRHTGESLKNSLKIIHRLCASYSINMIFGINAFRLLNYVSVTKKRVGMN